MSNPDRHTMRRYWPLVGVFVLAGLGTGAWLLVRHREQVTWGDQHEAAHTEKGDTAYYTCPMHPSVRQPSPGKCPICGMELTPVTREDLETGTVVVDEVRRQQIGVTTAPVQQRKLSRHIRAVGQVKVDETLLADVNLRMSGWVQELHVDETGQRVKKGQTLFTLYSPELYAAEREYLTAVRRTQEEGSEALVELARASEQRLRLLGMSESQIRQLKRRGEAWEYVPVPSPATGYVIDKEIVEGGRVEAGTRVYRIADLKRVWIDADVFESDLPEVRVNQPVLVQLPYVPGKTFQGRVGYIYPTIVGATRTARIRVALKNPDLVLKPEMYANVEMKVDLGEKLAIPDSAVIYTGPRRLVFVDLGEGRLRPQEIQIGARADGYVEVTRGLQPGDVVVTSGNFLIAAESRIRSATKYWGGAHDAN
jgi:Cu(I)/Ag(I) efflux system membrane fusion protein